MRKYIYYTVLTAALGFSAVSCNDMLEVEPQLSLSDKVALSSVNDVRVAVNGIYDGYQSIDYYGRSFIVIPEVASDNARITPTNSNRYLNFRDFTYTVANGDIAGFWNTAYAIIARSNNIINNMENVTDGTEAERNDLLGQALASRALAYFDLVRIFSQPYQNGGGSQLGVPIVLVTEIGTPARNTVGEVYTRVIEDLEDAKELMQTNDNAPERFSRAGAAALLSRVYLYKGDYQKSIDAANDASLAGFTLVSGDNYVKSFESYGSSEAIFQLKFEADENRGSDNLGNIFLPTGYGDIRPTFDLAATYAEGDKRAGWIKEGQRGTVTDIFAYKYPGQDGVPGLGSPIILRLSEVILNRAESYARLGGAANEALAIEDLNKIRTRAGLEPVGTELSGQPLIDAILLERRRELAFEGHRFFDIFRTGNDLVRVGQDCPGNSNCTIEYGDNLIAFPIPEREIKANPSIADQQNPGYN